jgi:uncharacterized protein (TIGR02145 family)/uncharacterized repeat protein (TIGR02543 family)
MKMFNNFKMLAAAMVAVMLMATAALAQGTSTAYVPFVVNANATVRAQQGEDVVSMEVVKNEEKVLILPRGTTSVWNAGGPRERLNTPLITASRGNIHLRLPPQSYQNAEFSLHSVNGKRVLRGKAAPTEAVIGVSRQNITAGVYLLSVKGVNGSAFTTRLTHSGGNLNIRVAFGAESVYQERRFEKKTAAEDGDWEITVAATGYITHTYTLRPVVGINERQVINLDVASPPQSQTYTLTIAVTGGGSVNPPVGTRTYDAGTFVTVTATANSGYTFKNWSGASTSTSATVNITINGNKTLTANFQQNDTPPPLPNITTFTDTRDGKTYKMIVIGKQTWMGENLNYDVPNNETDVCYNNSSDTCAKYGRLYNWNTAMNGVSSSSSSPSGVRGVCPVGWHLPSDAEWTALVGGSSTAGRALKSQNDWDSCGRAGSGKSYVCEDSYNFSALPGGYGLSDGSFSYAGYFGYWWSSTEKSGYDAWRRTMGYINENVGRYDSAKANLISVRCVQD